MGTTMNRKQWFHGIGIRLRQFSILAAIGIFLMVLAGNTPMELLIIPGFLLCTPLIFWIIVVPVYHWKERYIGQKSRLWGALLVLETSSWFKLIYWFRHILPDWQQTGRYENVE